MNKLYSLGIDVGSTTVKTVIIDEKNEILYSKYERHFSKVKETVEAQLEIIHKEYPNAEFKLAITGSAGLGLAEKSNLPFVQEVYAAFVAVKESYSDTDAVIELGGEDAKIIFITGGVEQRMNGSCAGGTGAFIDQMSTLLGITPTELDKLSESAEKIYPIASRCGVFAKSDIQPLLNQGARREDMAASIFQAVVAQTVSGLAQGRKIEGKVLFLGGPISFMDGLKRAFKSTLNLDDENAIFPKEAPVFMAFGCALYAGQLEETFKMDDVIDKIKSSSDNGQIITGERLFNSNSQYEEFVERHKKCDVGYSDIKNYEGDAYLGIDAGSTTTKMVLITPEGKILYQYYANNKGKPLDIIVKKLKDIYSICSDKLVIRSSAVTGYGEELIKAGMRVDHGIVETVAHYKAASFFCPDVDFIIDIGGQDIKCFKIKNHAIDSIMLNEACSSGCGSFIQTFAIALGYDIAEFSRIGLFAENPVDLGSRCTVFMNSSVKQAQKDGATVEDISAGLSSSIIKNAIYKVIRAKSVEELGKNIVVQGGTFLNDAVLRSFEMELGRNVVRPAIAGLMGAFGSALYAMECNDNKSNIITQEQLEKFEYSSKNTNCKGCTANCSLNIITFADKTKFISGNRCEKGAGLSKTNSIECMYEYKYNKLLDISNNQSQNYKVRVGLPLVLQNYEILPFWNTFFKEIGFATTLSDESSRDVYFKGQHTIPSDTACYPAKLSHGHIESLLAKEIDFIFYPCMSYNLDEGNSDNHYNCPVVAYYPELLKANIPELTDNNFIHPHIDINLKKHFIKTMNESLAVYNIGKGQISKAYDLALKSLKDYEADIVAKGKEIISNARSQGKKIIVLAGRPYHIDPEINHGIHKLITSLGLAVITEDCVAHLGNTPNLDILNQWTYHARLYKAAQYVTTQEDMQLVQLVSFGCGIDSITTDEIRSILEGSGKLYTQLKIDEINNLGAAKIRIRSLIAAINQ